MLYGIAGIAIGMYYITPLTKRKINLELLQAKVEGDCSLVSRPHTADLEQG